MRCYEILIIKYNIFGNEKPGVTERHFGLQLCPIRYGFCCVHAHPNARHDDAAQVRLGHVGVCCYQF